MIRLLKPLQFYKEKYGTYSYGLYKLYLLMEKQHNRGQEGAGMGCIKMHAPAGSEYVFRERALGPNAIQEIFSSVNHQIDNCHISQMPSEEVEASTPFIGEVYMGLLSYSITFLLSNNSDLNLTKRTAVCTTNSLPRALRAENSPHQLKTISTCVRCLSRPLRHGTADSSSAER